MIFTSPTSIRNMANHSRLQAEAALEEKTGECADLREDLENQKKYGAELKRGILEYKEQKQHFQDKIRYLTAKVHGDADADETFELRKVVPVVDNAVQCEPSVHDALFGKNAVSSETHLPPRSPLTGMNAPESASLSPDVDHAAAKLAAASAPAVGGAKENDETVQCNPS